MNNPTTKAVVITSYKASRRCLRLLYSSSGAELITIKSPIIINTAAATNSPYTNPVFNSYSNGFIKARLKENIDNTIPVIRMYKAVL